MWIDGHCHLADLRWETRRDALLHAAQAAGITGWVQGGVDPEDWERQRVLKQAWPGVVPVFGLHPWWIAEQTTPILEAAWQQLISTADLVAIGETGLDRARQRGERASYRFQRELFERHLQLAQDRKLPVILHIVQAHDEALTILSRFAGLQGLVHSFSESPALAERYLALGWHLSVGAEVTRPNAKLTAAIPHIPADRLILETDAPDQAPFAAGRRKSGLNEPINLLVMAQATAELRGTSREEVLRTSTANLRKLFDL